MVVFGIVWTAFVGVFDGFILTALYRQIRATGYAQTTGTVTHSELTRNSDGDGTTYGVRIEYTYTVNGSVLTGDRFRYNAGSSSDSGWARAAVREHPVGATIPVFFNPHNPADSVLKPGTNGADLFLLLFLTPFNMVSLGFIAGGVYALNRKFRPGIAGGVKWTDDGRFIRVRLPRYSPMFACLAIIGLGSFISIFIVGFSSGFHPSLLMIGSVWAVLLATGVGSALWLRFNEARGKTDLVINQVAQTVEVPATFGRDQRKTISFGTLSDITAEKVEHRSDDSSSYTYAVTLHHAGGGEKLTDWHDGERAESLAAWLREQIAIGESAAPPRKAANLSRA